MRSYGKTDIGLRRSSNQDAFSISMLPDGAILAVVCDGMGGANAGNVERSYRLGLSFDGAAALLNNAIISANIEVYDLSLKDPNLKGMGTTVVAAIVTNDFTVISHVGDSRAYIVGNEIRQVTRDHSVVQSLIESGKLTPEQARVHPRKNVITRALGTEEDVLPENNRCDLSVGETLLLCTDGLSNYVDTSGIKSIIESTQAEAVAEALINEANKNGGGDNITVVTVKKG